MMLTIHGLPKSTKYKDVKNLLYQVCNITDCILDKLVPDGNFMSLKLGVASEVEGAMLMRRINGYMMGDHRLLVKTVGNTMVSSNQPGNNFQTRNDYPPQNFDQPNNFHPRQDIQQNFNQPQNDYPGNNFQPVNSEQPHDPWGQTNQWGGNDMGASSVPFQQQQSAAPFHQQHYQQNAPFPQHNVSGNYVSKDVVPGGQHYPRRERDTVDSHAFPPRPAPAHASGPHRGAPGPDAPMPRAPPGPPGYGLHDKSLAIAKETLQGRGRPSFATAAAPGSPWSQSMAPQKPGVDFRRESRFSNQDTVDYSRRDEARDEKRDAPFRDTRDSFGGRKVEIIGRSQPGRKEEAYPARRRDDSPPRGGIPSRDGPPGREPPRRDDMPPRRDNVPLSRSDIMPRRDEMLKRDDIPPRRVGMMPGRDNMMPRRDDIMPRRDDIIPRRDNMGPRRDDMAPRRDGMMPRRDDILPRRDDIMPMPRRDDMPPRRDDMMPRRDDMAKRDALLPGKKRDSRSPRRYSPGRHSPHKRLPSPGRLRPERYSPSRNFEGPGRFPSKQVRPAYEPATHSAPKQANTGGYHPNMNESIQYAAHQQSANWQGDYGPKDERAFPKHFDNDRSERMRRSKERQSHTSFDRSPKDRFVNHSPSRSPRRSWATEKRRSPKPFDAPPPPSWPMEKGYGSQNAPMWKNDGKKDLNDERQGWKDHRPEQSFDRQSKPHSDNRGNRNERPMRDNRDFSEREIQDHKDFLNEMDRRHGGPKADPIRESKAQRTLAAQKIIERISKRYELTQRAKEEVQLELSKKIDKMFGTQIVSHNTILVKFENIYSSHDEDKIVQEVTSSLPARDRPRRLIEETPRTEASKPPEEDEKTRNKSIFKEQLKEKYKQTIEEIRNRMLVANNMRPGSVNFKRICEELNMVLLRILLKFGEQYGPACDIKRRFYQAYNSADETKMLEEIREKVSQESRKRIMPDASSMVPEKVSRHSGPNLTESDFNNMTPAKTSAPFTRWDKPDPMATVQQLLPAMYPPQVVEPEIPALMSLAMQPAPIETKPRGFDLYLCKDDFEPITEQEAAKLKSFLVSRIYEATASSGWVPNFIFKGLQGLHRYEVFTDDLESRDWLANLDFSDCFAVCSGVFYCNVLVYTSEELWYERAAIWLPGHSRCNNMNPLDKLKLQNKHIDNILNISSWKKVKTIVAPNGTRLYVDMPPSAARALEQKKLSLSYELQKVTVILKAAAVDKVVFDAGLRDASIVDQGVLNAAYLKSPIPVLGQDAAVVKIGFKGSRISAEQARYIKEMVTFKIFEYHSKQSSSLKTDFLRYGFCQPGHFGVVPENGDSRRWLRRLDLGKLEGRDLVVTDDESATKYLNMYIHVQNQNTSSAAAKRSIIDRLKSCNKDIKGINFSKWKIGSVDLKGPHRNRFLNLEIDLESVETLQRLNFILHNGRLSDVKVMHDYSYKSLRDAIARLKSEGEDSYDVANMELASNDSDFDMTDDVIQLD